MAHISFMHDAHFGRVFLFLDMLAEYTLLSMTVMVTPCLWYVIGMKLVCPMSKFPQAPFARAPFGECRRPESCASIFGKLHCRNCTATFAFLQCGSHCTRSCAATNAKMHCNIEKAATLKKPRCGKGCRKVALSCRFPADFRLPRLGPHF